jgi:hypothetical protein
MAILNSHSFSIVISKYFCWKYLGSEVAAVYSRSESYSSQPDFGMDPDPIPDLDTHFILRDLF